MATPTTAENGFSSLSSPNNFVGASRRSSWRRAWLPLLLLAASIVTTAGSGARLMRNFRFGLPPLAQDADFFPIPWMWHHPRAIGSGWSFSLTLLAILLAHEAGHFFYCRRHGISASWPYVLPAPTLSGTLGAVIRIRSRIPSRRALIEVGIAGPIAGYLVAVPAAILGLLLSRPIRTGAAPALVRFEQPLTITLLHHILTPFVPTLPRIPNLAPHPILIASWMGFFITSLNLIPAGQLDGGHILYALSPRWHRVMTFAVPLLLLAMGLKFWTGWLLWGAILLLPVMRHPRVPNFPLLEDSYRWLGWLALALLVLTLLPAPFMGTGLLELMR
jgi:membrane-associated protease RseP (regulator of RpoE activity)